MGTFFWESCTENDLIRQWTMLGLNIIVCFFTIVALLKTLRHYRRCIFELMPLSINVIAALTLLMLKLFGYSYRFNEVDHFIEIFLYFLFCYTFALMYSKATMNRNHEFIRKIWSVILAVAFIALLTSIILVFMKIIDKNCGATEVERNTSIINLALQALIFGPTAYYGYMIIKRLKKLRIRQQNEQGTISSLSQDIYYYERKKQIYLVLGVYAISLLLRTALVVFLQVQQTVINCQDDVLTSTQWYGQVILAFIQINQLLPNIVIPYAMYIVPLAKVRSASLIHFESGLIDDQLDLDQQSQEKISSLLTSQLSKHSGKRGTNNQ